MMLVSPVNEGMFKNDQWDTRNKLQPELPSMKAPLLTSLTEEVLQPNYTRCNFLVVDDNEINLRIMYQMLRKLFPQARIDTIQDSRLVDVSDVQQYHIVFLDIEMPVVTGLDIANVVRCDPRLNSVGLVAVTTKCMLNDVIVYKQSGFDYTFPKPFNLRDREILMRIEWVLKDRCGIANS